MSLIPLEHEIEIEKEKALCENRLDYLCKIMLGFGDWDKCHDDYMEWDLENENKRFRLILMPRGHLKTSIISIGKTIQDILKTPEKSILLASAVWDNARSYLSEIKQIFEGNRNLRRLYGEFRSDCWNSDEIIIKQRVKPSKTKTVETTGIERTKTSQHYDIIRADDLVTRENISTQDQIEKVITYFRDLIKLLEPNGTMEIVGTRWHDADLYGHIMDNLMKESLGESRFVMHKRSAIENGKPIFKNKFSIESLRVIKEQVGSFEYSANYDNEPIDPENQKFKPPIRYWTVMEDFKHYITVDPAISEKEDSCDAVVMDCALNGANQLCAVEYAALKESDKLPSKVIEKIFEYVLKYPNQDRTPKIVGIESNGYQAVLARLLEEEMRKRNIFFKIVEIRQNKDKNMRILELTPRWESGNLLLKQGMIELEDQLLRFPVSKKLDLIDALAMQLQIIEPKMERRPRVWVPQKYRSAA